MLASSLAGLIWYQFGADVTFIVTAFASILIGLYFIFMTTEKKHNLNTYALITLLYHKPPPIKAYHN
jgi:heme/copper-type cytochrome/quinol oxidase subunit 4